MSVEQKARVPVRYEMDAKIIRADGSVEDLGTIGSTAWRWYSIKSIVPRFRAWRRIKRANRNYRGE